MNNELKQKYLEQYNAMELLGESDLISDEVYRMIAFKLLRTIMGHFAVECNKIIEERDCEHCVYDYGTVECCISGCEKGHRRYKEVNHEADN